MNTIEENVKEYYGNIATLRSSCNSDQCCSTAAISEDPYIFSLGCGIGGAEEAKLGENVLDIGSGTGHDVFKSAKLVGINGWVTGVDMTEEMIKISQENAARLGINNVTFKLGNVNELPVDDDSIDLVLSNCVINLTVDKELSFREIYRVLKPNGRIIIQDVVSEGDLPDNIKNDKELWNSCIGGAISIERYIEAIRASGFEEIDIEEETAFTDSDHKLLSIRVKAVKPF